MRFLNDSSKKFGLRRPYRGKDVGMVVEFVYENEKKYGLIVDPEWDGKMHTLKLDITNQKDLEELLLDLDRFSDYRDLLTKYQSSKYAPERPYRTYTLKKVSNLREIYLKG